MGCDSTNTLPPGWAKCSIGDVSLPISKIDPKDNPDREIKYIDISSIDNIRHVIGSVKQYRLTDAPSRARQIVHAGDVLLATVRPYLRNIAGVPIDYDEQIASTGFSVLRPAKGISPDFLFYKAISNDFVNALSEAQYGVSYPAVKDDQIRDQPLWLPPTDEQLRVVAKIEELFSELDKGAESLRQARRQLTLYRQSVLKHAFEGKLTAQWRAENKEKLETPDQLLARIKREQKARHEKQLKEWKAAVEVWNADSRLGKKPPRPKKATHPIPVAVEDLLALDKLPEGWYWSAFSAIAASIQIGPFGSLLHKKDYLVGGTPLVNPSHIRCQRIEPDRALTVSPDKLNQLRKYVMQENDIVIGRRGEMGRCTVVTVAEAGWLCGTGSLFVRLLPSMNPYFYSWVMSSKRVKDFLAASSIGTTMQNLNEGILHRVPVPVCSRHEQDEALREIDRQYSTLDQIEAGIDSWIAKSITLRQSILKKAFSGQLVPQDPDDEPASVILDRIKAQRKQRVESTMVRRRTKKKRDLA